MGEGNKAGSKDAFYTYHNGGHTPVTSVPADDTAHNEPVPPEAALRAEEAYLAEFPMPDDAAKRKKRVRGILGIALFAVALCAVALAAGAFGVAGLTFAGSGSTAPIVAEKDLSVAAVYLNSLPWDKKPHDSLKHLEKMKNVRSALRFFERYPPSEIAAMKASPATVDGAVADYATLAGSLAEINARILGIQAVDESISIDTNAQSTLLSLDTGGKIGSASLLVIGAPGEGVREGGAITCKCIPIYLYVPKDGPELGGIFFITESDLVKSAG